MSRSHYYHIDAMVNNVATAPLEPVLSPATQPVVERPTRGTADVLTTSPVFTMPTYTPTMSIDEGDSRGNALTPRPVFTMPVYTPTVTVPISDVVPVTLAAPTAIKPMPTYGGGGGGGAMSTPKPQTKELMETPKPSFLKRNWLPILLIGSAVFILIKKPIK